MVASPLDAASLREELGDLLSQAYFHPAIAEERGGAGDSAQAIDQRAMTAQIGQRRLQQRRPLGLAAQFVAKPSRRRQPIAQ